MTESTSFALASVPAASTDPRLLTMHLDICRMRAELELLEGRISRIRASEAEAAADTRPFVDRAQDLVDRTVGSLLEAGRAEIEATDRQSIADAEGRMAEANRQARLLIAAAREELAAALTERAETAERVRRSAADVVILPDEGLVVLPGDDLVVLPDDGRVLPGDDAVMSSADRLVVLPGDDVVLVLPDDDGVLAVGAGVAAASETAVIAVVEPAHDPEPVVVDQPSGPSAFFADEGWVPAAPVASVAEVTPPPPPPAPSDVAPAPAPVEPVASAAPATGSADAAFDLWLSMAPPADDTPTPDAEEMPDVESAGRPGWLRPLEAVVALILVALVVAVGLVLVG